MMVVRGCENPDAVSFTWNRKCLPDRVNAVGGASQLGEAVPLIL